MTLKDFVQENNADYVGRRITQQDIPLMEVFLGVSMGPQLQAYLVDYGYLGYEFAELYGITASQGPQSDMIKETNRLHNHYPETKELIAIEDQGDGDYYLADNQDNMYRFLSATGQLTAQNIKLLDYILARFESIKALCQGSSAE